jgi:hypothetical protein
VTEHVPGFDDPPTLEQLEGWYRQVKAGRLKSKWFSKAEGLAWLTSEIAKRKREGGDG